MISRSRLVLMDSLVRSPLRVLREYDERHRALERRAQSDPGDREAHAALGRSSKRAGPPDSEHNWRFNGKGWFTRPQWNGGKCPPESKATQHNTCIGDNDPDKRQYNTKSPEKEGSNGDDQSVDRWTRRAEIARTPDVENSPIHSKPGSQVNWDHPNGPKVYEPYENEKPRDLPNSPEHLGQALTSGRPGRRGSSRQSDQDKLAKHYIDQGYDEKYVRSTLSGREKNADISGLSDADVERLPDRKTTLRAAKKKRVVDQRRRDDEEAARAAQRAALRASRVDDYGYYDDGQDGYDYDYDGDRAYGDDWDDDDDRYDRYDRNGESPVIGGYENHPGYPGHPDYPQFDGSSAEHEKDTQDRNQARQRDRDHWDTRWTRNSNRHASRPEPDTSPGEFTGPAGRGEPNWPRTGERKNPQDNESPDQFDNPRSGREAGSNRTSGRSYMGGGRGRTNFRRRGGPRHA